MILLFSAVFNLISCTLANWQLDALVLLTVSTQAFPPPQI